MNIFQKLYYKALRPKKYSEYKKAKKENDLIDSMKKIGSKPIVLSKKPCYSFKHSGHCGDIVYSLPAIFAIADRFGESKAKIFIDTGCPSVYKDNMGHPAGNVMVSDTLFNQLRPLLISQRTIIECERYVAQPIDCDMNLFRCYPILHDRGDISRWYFQVFPVSYDLSKPWLDVPLNTVASDGIVVSRSARHRAPHIDYGFLKKYSKIFFVGIESEYFDMRQQIPHINWLETRDFLELASVIAGSGLFIGNQSLPFALAEALKVDRMLEVYYKTPNVIASGGNSFVFSLQNCFEYIVENYFESGSTLFTLS